MKSIRTIFAALAAFCLAASLAACGGGSGAGAQGGAPGAGDAGGGATAALDLFAGAPTVGTDGRLTATVTAVAKDAANRALSGQQVTFGTSDAGVVLVGASALTDASGTVTATLVINDRTNRSVTVQATAGTLTRTVSVTVVGENAPASVAARLDLLASSPTIGSDGRTLATISALTRDGENRALEGQKVEFGTTDAGAVLTVVSGTTNASGVATATLRLIDQTNRPITLKARTGSLETSVTLQVVGTAVTLAGPASLAREGSAEFTVGLRDSSGTALPGKTVAVSSAKGNAINAASVVTDAAGQARFTVTGTQPGTDTLTVASTGATATAALEVSSKLLAFAAPTAAQEVPVSTDQPVTVVYTEGGVPQAGQTVRFVSTRGTLSTSTKTTGPDGIATVWLNSPTAGAATVTAIVGSVTTAQRIEFVSRTPAKVSLQATPANVAVNLSTSSTNSAQLIAVVRDAADNPVKGQTVAFSADADPSNGRIEPAVAVTDSAGVAAVAFFPGANSSGFNQISVRARVLSDNPAVNVTGSATLTASRQELFVRVGTGRTMEEYDIATYSMPWSVVVTDASGGPVQGAVVQAASVSTRFIKGYYAPLVDQWVPVQTQKCESEDSNGNLRFDAGEDVNGDGVLTPGNVASASVVSAGQRTDANGVAGIRVIYPRSFANWVEVELRVTGAVIAGTEGVAVVRFVLPALAADLRIPGSPPGGESSRFGREPGCGNRE